MQTITERVRLFGRIYVSFDDLGTSIKATLIDAKKVERYTCHEVKTLTPEQYAYVIEVPDDQEIFKRAVALWGIQHG